MNHAAADNFVREHMDLPFDWESNNCCTFCGGFVKALTGSYFLLPSHSVTNLRDALRVVREHGNLADAVTKQMGDPMPPLLAQYGDVVLIPDTEGVGDSIGICVGANVLAPGPKGLAVAPLSVATHAWRPPLVPHP